MQLLNIGSAIGSWLVLTTGLCYMYLPPYPETHIPICCLLFFNNLNIFIAMCEIALGIHIMKVKAEYKELREKYKGKEKSACVAFLFHPLTVAEVFSLQTWTLMWSTYSLYDPSYQNHETFGFFIDFGNGLSTIPPSLMMTYAILFPHQINSFVVGCVGLAMYWQKMYGTIIYLLSFVYNKRYVGFPAMEVAGFVAVINSVWIFFPCIGLYLCILMLKDGALS